MKRLIPFAVVLLAVMTQSCDKLLLGESDAVVSIRENQQTPPANGDGWEVGVLDTELSNPAPIKQFIQRLQKDHNNIHSVVIVKNNKLLVDAYFNGWHRDRLQSLRSATKSVTSALVGIAIDKGFIADENERLFSFFPEYADLNTPEKNDIRLWHVLTMTSGLEWRQSASSDDDPRDDEHQLNKSEDGLRYTLTKKLVTKPGGNFNYSSGSSDLLAGIIHHATGLHADAFAAERLFAPLMITKFGWRKQINGYNNAGYGLHLLPRDMAKVGQLFLDSGRWKGQQVISSDWVVRSTKPYSTVSSARSLSYAYQWWTRSWVIDGQKIDAVLAQGNGGQIICILPGLRSVVVLTGGNYGESDQPYYFLQGYILPALM